VPAEYTSPLESTPTPATISTSFGCAPPINEENNRAGGFAFGLIDATNGEPLDGEMTTGVGLVWIGFMRGKLVSEFPTA
jgi:hypothetical protein